MKLTFFIGGLSGGGAERVVCNLANYLVSHDHEVDILTTGDDPNYGLDARIQRITLLYKNERKNAILNSLKRLFRLIRYLKNRRDAFIVMLPVTTILLLRLRVFVKGKIIASERSFPTNYSIQVQRQLRVLSKYADAWVFQTKNAKQWYSPYLGEVKHAIIPNPINKSFIFSKHIGGRNREIVTAGRLISVKNHKLLIEAFSRICNEYPDATLAIYGEGPLLAELKELSESLGVGKKVSFPGFMPWGEESKNSAMFVLSSDLEGMPNALMEAMAMGLPCVSTDCDGGGARYLIENGKNGLLIPKNDVDALATAMQRMLSDREFANSCGFEAQKICERLAPEKIYGEWESFIEEIVNS